MFVTRTERGWAGHFVASQSCLFRRNTLLECWGVGLVVSTVGNYYPREWSAQRETLRSDGVLHETMVFRADMADHYQDATGEEFGHLGDALGEEGDDNDANDMHEAAVRRTTRWLRWNGWRLRASDLLSVED